jgi:hypothetical protein
MWSVRNLNVRKLRFTRTVCLQAQKVVNYVNEHLAFQLSQGNV